MIFKYERKSVRSGLALCFRGDKQKASGIFFVMHIFLFFGHSSGKIARGIRIKRPFFVETLSNIKNRIYTHIKQTQKDNISRHENIVLAYKMFIIKCKNRHLDTAAKDSRYSDISKLGIHIFFLKIPCHSIF
jgi:hypothetical protein